MSRLDKLDEILDGYEGRKYQEEKEEIKLTEEEVNRALTEVTERMGMRNQVEKLDYEAKEAIAKAYYTSLFIHAGKSTWQTAQVNSFCQDLEVCLNNNPENVKNFAEDYARNLEENA